MSSLGAAWKIWRAYAPNAAKKPNSQANPDRHFGPFVPSYTGTAWRRPRTDDEAQKLYNHMRTCAFLMDASPLLTDLGLPFKAGLDDIVSLVPLYGDALSAVLGFYGLWLAFLFGVPLNLIFWMAVNVLVDFVVGVVPIIGDILDNLFKANIRNLRLVEDHLLANNTYNILLMPLGNDFLPPPYKPGFFARKAKEDGARKPGAKGRRTRRMEAWEGSAMNPTPPAGPPDDGAVDLD
ncbi:hypothetical protein BDY24DRAFT_419032 [Mrakia frigida]|uniref:DUF4112 domain-containing protein n=1 Tax=Mrakia frigida TaxID=29902 RepID=UPI003FCC2519